MNGQDHNHSGAVPAEFNSWARGYLVARSERATSTRINAMYDAVNLVLGPATDAHSSAAWERAWKAFCDALETISRARGFDRHPHRTRGAAHDN